MSNGFPNAKDLMSNGFPKEEWRERYRAALFETDKSKVAERISDAERVIVARVRSLFDHPSDPTAERNALDSALYALRILRIYARVQCNDANSGRQPLGGSL